MQGKIVSVYSYPLGARTYIGSVAGSSTLIVNDASAFSVDGGRMSISGVGLVVYDSVTFAEAGDSIHLQVPLGVTLNADQEVLVHPAGRSTEALVQLDLAGGEDAVRVHVPSTNDLRLVEGNRELEEQENCVVEFRNGRYELQQVETPDSTIAFSAITDVPDLSVPSQAPAESPELTAYQDQGGGGVLLDWEAPEDARTYVRIFVGLSIGDPMDDTTLWTAGVIGGGPLKITSRFPGGEVLDPEVSYYFALQAYNVLADGSYALAPATTWVVGRPSQIAAKFFAMDGIIENLKTRTLESVNLVGSTGSFDRMILNGFLRIYGGEESTLSGPLIAAQGVPNPDDPPNVSLDWETLPVANVGAMYMRGLYDDGDNWLSVRYGPLYSKIRMYVIRKSDGFTYYRDLDAGVGGRNGLGLCKVGDYYCVLWYRPRYRDGFNVWIEAGYSITTFYKFLDSNGNINFDTMYYNDDLFPGDTFSSGSYPTLTSAGAPYAHVVYTSAGGNNAYYIRCTVNASTGRVTGTRSSAQIITEPGNLGIPNLSGAYLGSADFGANRWVMAPVGTVGLRVADTTSSHTRLPAEEWPGAGYVYGFCKGSDDYFYALTAAGVARYTANRSGPTRYAYAWLDNDPLGSGTAETGPSDVATVNVNRQRVSVRIPSAPPDDGTQDGANTAVILAATGVNPLRVQTEMTELDAKNQSPVLYVLPPNTTGRLQQTINGFDGRPGGIGSYRSAAADSKGSLSQLNGDGTWRRAGGDLDGSSVVPVLASGWSNYGADLLTVRYRGDFLRVYISGTIKGSGALLFTLEPGFRPIAQEPFIVLGNGALARVNVLANGEVRLFSGSGTSFLTLSGITFDRAQ